MGVAYSKGLCPTSLRRGAWCLVHMNLRRVVRLRCLVGPPLGVGGIRTCGGLLANLRICWLVSAFFYVIPDVEPSSGAQPQRRRRRAGQNQSLGAGEILGLVADLGQGGDLDQQRADGRICRVW